MPATLHINVATLSGDVRTFDIAAGSSIGGLRAEVSRSFGLHPASFHLTHCNSCLADDDALDHLVPHGEPASVSLGLVVSQGHADIVEKIRKQYGDTHGQVTAKAEQAGDWVIIARHVDYDSNDDFSFSLFHIPSWKPTVEPLVRYSYNVTYRDEGPHGPPCKLTFGQPGEAVLLVQWGEQAGEVAETIRLDGLAAEALRKSAAGCDPELCLPGCTNPRNGLHHIKCPNHPKNAPKP
eukprot:CAMPEP_0204523284 /NCGR_PEP_ID=MMETSP0661-20131031/6765_1 /ASSEMBLY_ACC=CAM_ASM_000606 /TAXON_ID=109239 /ORGANISM="Alexandrium margalefi, Strain AMGDE01CS-322" /LENGTH=236 /DNA_ID=CAMNT_0051528983 /DNA_START=68 /DNA_END=778 /DNA_ORIENTATION=-